MLKNYTIGLKNTQYGQRYVHISALIITMLCLSLANQACAWSGTGHKIVAAIAYEHLTPKAKAHVNALIINQPYAQDDNFISASTWADEIKGRHIKIFNSWHYVNRAIKHYHSPKRGKYRRLPKPAYYNITRAFAQAEQVLLNPKSSDAEKAFFLRFYIHLIGDMHQPLHMASLVSERFPRGDRGGNAYPIRYHGINNLHKLWDQGVGLFAAQRRNVSALQRLATKAYPQNTLQSQIRLNAEQWADESYVLARDYAYQTPPGRHPTKGYIVVNQKVIQRQLALAGYRLAYRLNQIFDSSTSGVV